MDKTTTSPSTDLTSGAYFPLKYKDNGDGTFAQAVALTNVEPVYVSVGTSVEIANDIGNPIPVDVAQRTCLGMEKIAVTTSAVSTLTVPTGAVSAQIQADGAAVSITLNTASTPTANTGFRLDDGNFIYVDSILAQVKLIARTTNTSVQVAYFNKV